MASINEKLERVRKPRVHIKYEVETEGAQIQKELPFVVGVLGDYAGNNPGEEIKPLKDRKFVNIDRDNFDAVMSNMQPGVNLHVENKNVSYQKLPWNQFLILWNMPSILDSLNKDLSFDCRF